MNGKATFTGIMVVYCENVRFQDNTSKEQVKEKKIITIRVRVFHTLKIKVFNSVYCFKQNKQQTKKNVLRKKQNTFDIFCSCFNKV